MFCAHNNLHGDARDDGGAGQEGRDGSVDERRFVVLGTRYYLCAHIAVSALVMAALSRISGNACERCANEGAGVLRGQLAG